MRTGFGRGEGEAPVDKCALVLVLFFEISRGVGFSYKFWVKIFGFYLFLVAFRNDI